MEAEYTFYDSVVEWLSIWWYYYYYNE
jgi:hypothetical protein